MKTILCVAVLIHAVHALAAPSHLVIFVHGFGGNEVIERVYRNERNERGSVGEFNAVYDVLKQKAEAKGESLDFAAFKYDTKHHLNADAGRALNQMLLSNLPTDPEFPLNNVLPPKYQDVIPDRVTFITLSNGNLVLRQAIVQAVQSANSRLLKLYHRATVFDISPILGGAADARGALLGRRYQEIDPFGPSMQTLFDEAHVRAYDQAIRDRHYTFLVCGDPFTRGIWNFFSGTRQNPAWNPFNWLSTTLRGQRWIAENYEWFANFERARGADPIHHIEFAQTFAGDDYCRYDAYRSNLNEFLEDPATKAFTVQNKGESLFESHWGDRLSQKGKRYVQALSSHASDYLLDDLGQIYPAYDKTGRKILSSFSGPEGARTLNERHTILIYYRPLLEYIADQALNP